MAGQITIILFGSLILLIALQLIFKVVQRDSVIELAQRSWIKDRIESQINTPKFIEQSNYKKLIQQKSACHEGYTFSDEPYNFNVQSTKTKQLERSLSNQLNWNINKIKVGYATLTRNDFSYDKCEEELFKFPINGIVISVQLPDGSWINSEVHDHHLHFDDFVSSVRDSIIAFILIAIIAIAFISKLTKPLSSLNKAALNFAQGLNVSKLDETGPLDVKRTIQSFNVMQRQVKEQVTNHMNTLAAISHDIRSPLTALRIKAELLKNVEDREGLLSSVEKMEKITASALEFLKGESRSEALKKVDLATLVESVCYEFSESGYNVCYVGVRSILQKCRPDALERAIRNLIENAVKYGESASVNLTVCEKFVTISVMDQGPGIPKNEINYLMQPFKRLSKARESEKGGFGLGLAIVKSIAEGHNSTLKITNHSSGLTASIVLSREL